MISNTALNIFLALLEERPEVARRLYGSMPQKFAANELSTIHGRIQQAAENLKCVAVKQAIRIVLGKSLRLEVPTFPQLAKDKKNAKRIEELQEAYLMGVRDTEELLADAITTCEEIEKPLGPGDHLVTRSRI